MRQLLEVEESLGNQSAIDPKKGDVVWYHVTEYIYIRDCICMSLLYYIIKNHYNTICPNLEHLKHFTDWSPISAFERGLTSFLPVHLPGSLDLLPIVC